VSRAYAFSLSILVGRIGKKGFSEGPSVVRGAGVVGMGREFEPGRLAGVRVVGVVGMATEFELWGFTVVRGGGVVGAGGMGEECESGWFTVVGVVRVVAVTGVGSEERVAADG